MNSARPSLLPKTPQSPGAEAWSVIKFYTNVKGWSSPIYPHRVKTLIHLTLHTEFFRISNP